MSQDKLHFSFSLYDIDQTGQIKPAEMVRAAAATAAAAAARFVARPSAAAAAARCVTQQSAAAAAKRLRF